MRFGIIGCGMISDFHINAVNAIDGAILAGVTDADMAKARSTAEKYNTVAYDSYGAMLDDGSIDTICICTPSFLHAENVVSALRSGKNVIVEKPMALNLRDAEQIVFESKRSGKLLTVISQLLYAPDVQKAKKIIASGKLGRIVMVDLSMKYYRSPEYYSSSTWHGKLFAEGGGALMNQGIHGISLMQYLAGGVKKVSGKIRTLVHDIETEDTAAAVLEFDCGAVGVVTATTSVYPGYERRLTICGDKGSIVLKEDTIERIDTADESYRRQENDDDVSGFNQPMNIKNEGHIKQITNFINACSGKEKLLLSAEDGLAAVKLILDIYSSSD